jgi:hypothetical protein
MKTSLFFILILSLGFFVFCKQFPNQANQAKTEWIPATINGIVLGKSKYEDIVKLWGDPNYKAEFAADPYEPKSGEILPETQLELGYRNIKIDGFLHNVGVLVGNETRLVKTISLNIDEMTKDEAVQKYGSDYYLIFSSDSTCIDKSQKRKKKVSEQDYPIKLVYPQKGMSILVKNDNTVMMVNYTDKCK